jgi:23S rRNA (pseudouridine1915-N3)-methyltransferase
MNIQIVSVGRLKGNHAYLQDGIDHYLKLTRPYAKITITEVADEPLTPSRTLEQTLDAEAKRILPYLEKAACVVALWEKGKLYDSETFAAELAKRGMATNPLNGGIGQPGSTHMIVVIGGPWGLSRSVLDRADWLLSLSPMTLPHPMVRLVLLEQLYRAFKIQRNEAYHK